MQTYATTNLSTFDYRLSQPRPVVTREGRIAYLKDALDVLSAFNWTPSYKAMETELTELESEVAG